MDINQLGLPDDSLLDHIDYRTYRRKINKILMISIIICFILLILSILFVYLFIKKQELSLSIQHSTISGQMNNLSLIGNLILSIKKDLF